jgi:hypothetical protein
MSKLPKKIIIEDGLLKMADGSSLQEYLRDYQKRASLPDGDFVNLMSREELVQTMEDARLVMRWAS